MEAYAVGHVAQFFAEREADGYVYERQAGYLARDGDGAACARVGLDYPEGPAAQDELYVEQAVDVELA